MPFMRPSASTTGMAARLYSAKSRLTDSWSSVSPTVTRSVFMISRTGVPGRAANRSRKERTPSRRRPGSVT